VDPRVPRGGDRVEGPRLIPVREELMLDSAGTLEPVVDRVGRDRCGQRPEVCGRRAGKAGELLETPMCQSRWRSGTVAYGERVGCHSLHIGPDPIWWTG
jgi:hypothetical protein